MIDVINQLIKTILILAFMLSSLPVFAKDEQGQFKIYGVGRLACSKYIEAVYQKEKQNVSSPFYLFREFTLGMLSGISVSETGMVGYLGSFNFDEAMKVTEAHCVANPDQEYWISVLMLKEAVVKIHKESTK